LSVTGKKLAENHWLYDKEGNLLDRQISEITMDVLNEKYKFDDKNIDNLERALGLKLDEIRRIEEETGGIFIYEEEYNEFQEFKKNKDANKNGKDPWNPDCKPDDANPTTEKLELQVTIDPDLSGQYEGMENNEADDENGEEEGQGENDDEDDENQQPDYSKEIGDWGEQCVKNYLESEYGANEVVWLNQKKNVGKGYDFVIRKDDEEILFVEVKSKVDERPKTFDITKTQWRWAQRLHMEGRGDMYQLILVSNTGTTKPKISIVGNPYTLWIEHKLNATPIKITL